MNAKKRIILAFLVLLLVAVAILFRFGGNCMRSTRVLHKYSRIIEQVDVNDLSLTIYYMSPWILTTFPLSVDGLINHSITEKTIVSGSDLKEHFDLFKQINNDVLIPVRRRSPYLNVRLYYVLECRINGRLLDVVMWSSEENIIVNGVEVKEHYIFYDIIIPFLPESAAEQWSRWRLDLLGENIP